MPPETGSGEEGSETEKGLVAAASMTSQMLRPMRPKSPFSSFTEDDVDAPVNVLQELRCFGDARVGHRHDAIDDHSVQGRCHFTAGWSQTPDHLGMVRVLKSWLFGSSRSGEKARWKSRPARRPPASRMGRSTSSVVPG